MSFDLILTGARIGGCEEAERQIGVNGGRIVAVAPDLHSEGPVIALAGRLVLPGFVETHLHLDKSCLSSRCVCSRGTLEEAVASVAAAKKEFNETDVYERARTTLEKSIKQGTTRIRTHLEVDPRIGLTSLHAIKQLRQDYAWAVDLSICAFPQEGLLDDPGCEEVLIRALESGADLIGGAPYMDRDSRGHIELIFDIAKRFDVDIDLHLDFLGDPSHLDITEVCRQSDAAGWGGRVAVGHVTKLASLSADRIDEIGRMLADSGVAVTVLPATDLFLGGRGTDHDIPRGVAPAHRLRERGVTCSISTNNVLNPFTPYGDCSLVRMANLYANVSHIGSPAGMAACLDMITAAPAKLMRLCDYGIAAGMVADFVVLDCTSSAAAIAELAQPVCGFKAGRRTFERPVSTLVYPPSFNRVPAQASAT